MSIFDSFNINSSGMTAQRFRMDIISENIANANTTRTADGSPYVRKVVTFAEKGTQTPFSKILNERLDHYSGRGVKVVSVQDDSWTQMNIVYDPSHPDADENGYIRTSNVNAMVDIADALVAQRAYEANLALVNITKSMAQRALEIGK